MDDIFYRRAMEADCIEPKAIACRLSRANKGEKILNRDFDMIIVSDDLMYDSLVILKHYDNPRNAPLQNALRKYYFYRNGREFPRLQHYRR